MSSRTPRYALHRRVMFCSALSPLYRLLTRLPDERMLEPTFYNRPPSCQDYERLAPIMLHRGELPTDVDFLEWFDALPLEMQREVVAELRRQCRVLGLAVVPTHADFAQPVLHLPPRFDPVSSFN